VIVSFPDLGQDGIAPIQRWGEVITRSRR